MGTPQPHDTLFHFTFHQVRHAAGWVRSVLPAALAAAIDWTSLRAAPEKVHGRALRFAVTDILLLAELAASGHTIAFVPEHKSGPAPELQAQLLGYCVHVGETMGPTNGPPPLVIPILLSHAEEPWPGTPPSHPHLAELDPGAAKALAAVQPRLTFFIDDLTRCTEQHLRRPGLTALAQLTLLCLRFLPDASSSEALAAFDRWQDLLRAVDADEGPPSGPAAVAAIGEYALVTTGVEPVNLHTAFQRILQRSEETIMTTVQNLIQRSRAETLLRQMAKRFGAPSDETIRRVRAATPAELDIWLDRILDAESVAELFAEA
ncbi:MAG: Rpn family recombination-promoting nuclease/putative transposase [Planctomycetota bacterium]